MISVTMQSSDPIIAKQTTEEQADEPGSDDADSTDESLDSKKTLEEIIESYSN